MPTIISAKYFLVRKAGFSNKDANRLLSEFQLYVNGVPCLCEDLIYPADEVSLNGELLQKGRKMHYLAFNKPRGIECTMNEAIPEGLVPFFRSYDSIFPVGRLDKESEGLLLMTNDGHLYKRLALSDAQKEKEYIVTVDQKVSDEQLMQLSGGVFIIGQMTKPARVHRVDENAFNIVLTQGLNRQIRRMCYKLDLEVTRLVRVRIDTLKLDAMGRGEVRELEETEISALKGLRSS